MKKSVSNEFIVAVGDLYNGQTISDSEYAQILAAFSEKPIVENGYTYKLRDGALTWERVPIEPEPLTDEEALTRYANSLTGADDPDLISAAETLITDRIKEDSK